MKKFLALILLFIPISCVRMDINTCDKYFIEYTVYDDVRYYYRESNWNMAVGDGKYSHTSKVGPVKDGFICDLKTAYPTKMKISITRIIQSNRYITIEDFKNIEIYGKGISYKIE